MKLIHKFKSPNFNTRKSKEINFIIIHYTALKSISESIEYLCNKKNKVSSHYLISKRGEIYNLVDEDKRAWHAGKSYWKGNTDINSSSIGIELDYFPDKQNTKYTTNLLNSLIKLLKKIIKKYNISKDNILGHSDIAPYRKIDPGLNFPWFLLEEKKIAFRVKKLQKNREIQSLIKTWYKKNKFYSIKKKLLFILDYIGYDVSLAKKNNSDFNKLLLIYSYRFQNFYKHLLNKKQLLELIEMHFLNILLTKLKK